MEHLISEVRRRSKNLDEVERKMLLNQLRDLQYSLEAPEDTMQRVMYMHMVLAVVRVALDLRLFELLRDAKRSVHVDDLSAQTSADPVLLGRILRMLASLGYITETGVSQFTTNNVTENLCIPEIQAGIRHIFDIHGAVNQTLPKFLQQTSYRNPTNPVGGVFQAAWKTPLPFFSWLHHDYAATSRFTLFMRALRSSTPSCFDFYPIEDECRHWASERPLLVDIGGGTGQQCIDLKRRYPHLKGPIVFQELEPAVEAMRLVLPPGVLPMVHDYFTLQPVRGAKFYYLRAILHDNTDELCVKILKRIIPAMAPESKILIDEMVMGTHGMDWFATQTDIAMMCAVSGQERTEEQWRKILHAAGLRMGKIYPYTYSYRLCLIEAIL